MEGKSTSMIMGSFIGDALALGAHWVYNTRVIDKKFGDNVDHYQNPLTSYHKGKKAGDFTHYGDQMLVLLTSLADTKTYDPNHFAKEWRLFFQTYGGYFDKATKTTLQNMQDGSNLLNSGSNSDDLAGAARIAPLVYLYQSEPKELMECVHSQTAITHNNEQVLEAAKFFALVVSSVLNGRSPSDALERVLSTDRFSNGLTDLVREGINSRNRETRETIGSFGQMCEIEAALPGTIHLITTYETDFKRAQVENIMAGGDSAARGMLVGMVLGAHLGMEAILDYWLSELTAYRRIKTLLETLDN